MPLATLTEGNKYSSTEIDRSVIDLLTKDEVVLQNLKFEELLGNSLTYDMITTRSTADFRGVGETWTESVLALTQDTVTLKILGGDADVDNFLKKTRSNKIDLAATVLADKVLSVKEKFMYGFYYGNATSNALEFNGLHALMSSTTYNTVHAGATTGTALSIAKLYQAIDLIRGYKPDVMIMTRAMRRGIQIYLDTIGEKYPTERDKYGKLQAHFGEIPIYVDDNLLDTETSTDGTGAYLAATGGGNTSIFILSFDHQSVQGVQGPDSIETIPLGDLETKDAQRWRVRWYCGLMFENLRSCAKVDGIVAAGTVTA